MRTSKKQGVMEKSSWPEPLRHPSVTGVFVGGCVDRGVGSAFPGKAHVHIHGPRAGWVCFRSTRWLNCTPLILHELAHAVTREGHTQTWREYLQAVGGTVKEIKGILSSYEYDHDT